MRKLWHHLFSLKVVRFRDHEPEEFELRYRERKTRVSAGRSPQSIARRCWQLAFCLGVACATAKMVGENPGDHRTHTHQWEHHKVVCVSEQAWIPDSFWQNNGVATWTDGTGKELARGFFINGLPWDGTFLISLESWPNDSYAKLAGLQEWSQGHLLKSVVPEWCIATLEDAGEKDLKLYEFLIPHHVNAKITKDFTRDREILSDWITPIKVLKEVPLAEHAVKTKLKECYRMIEFPSFQPVRSIRIDVDANDAARVYVRKTDGMMAGYTMTRIDATGEAPLIPAVLKVLRKLLEGTMLFSDTPELNDSTVLDGTTYILECVRQETYFATEYRHPELQPVIEVVDFFHRLGAPYNVIPSK
jgi:hypothetical protein